VARHGPRYCGTVGRTRQRLPTLCAARLKQVICSAGLGFRPGTFDGVISISALQWLCNADKKHHVPKKRLAAFFTSLYSCMARGARGVHIHYMARG
jgi:hypothetical protein